MKERPLGKLSDFVVETLPEKLEAPSPALIQQCETLLVTLSPGVIVQVVQSDAHGIASLDAKMIEAGIVHSGFTPPPRLVELVDQLSAGEVPVLTYEELVLVNPTGDLRKFTRGEIGETETAFYLEHRFIEECLERAVVKLRRAVEALLPNMALAHNPNIPAAAGALIGVASDLMPVIAFTVKLGQMPEGHFEVFRKYLSSHPLRNLKGPSGVFTARIPLLELLFRGDELPTEYTRYLGVNWQYFPRQGRSEITEALEWVRSKNTLVSLWRRQGQPQELLGCITVIGEFFDKFRLAHYRTVARQIPSVLRGEGPGTGGETAVREFLLGRMQVRHPGTR